MKSVNVGESWGERRSALNEKINHAESEIQGGWVRYAPEDLARVAGWRAEVVECIADIEACAAEYKTVPGGLRPTRSSNGFDPSRAGVATALASRPSS